MSRYCHIVESPLQMFENGCQCRREVYIFLVHTPQVRDEEEVVRENIEEKELLVYMDDHGVCHMR